MVAVWVTVHEGVKVVVEVAVLVNVVVEVNQVPVGVPDRVIVKVGVMVDV